MPIHHDLATGWPFMGLFRSMLLPLAATTFIAFPVPGATHEIFVSPTGHDGNEGCRHHPLLTLTAARDHVRALREQGRIARHDDVTVWLAGGVYPLRETLFLEAMDSGVAGHPITYAALPGAEVVLSGGTEIHCDKSPNAQEQSRLPPQARGHVVKASLRERGITNWGTMQPRCAGRPMYPAPLELFSNDQPLTLARWPNAGNYAAVAGSTPNSIRLPRELWQSCLACGDLWMRAPWHTHHMSSWESVKAEKARPDELQLVSTISPHPQVVAGQPCTLFNALELLDAPGEWYLNRDTGELFAWPRDAANSQSFIVTTTNTLVCCDNAAHLRFLGVTFRYARVSAVEILDGADISLEQCQVENIGNIGVSIQQGHAHRVINCQFHQLGDGGVRVEGGDIDAHAASHHHVQQCYFERWNRSELSHRSAIYVCGYGQRVTNNRFAGEGPTLFTFGEGHQVSDNILVGK